MSYEIDWERFARLSPEEQQAVARALQEIEGAAETNPLLFFHPHAKQKPFLASQKRFKWILGGNRSGKTTACTIDDLIQAVDEDCLPDHLKPYKRWQPPFYWRVVATDMNMLHSVVLPEIQRWIPRRMLIRGDWQKSYDKQHDVLHLANGSRCQFKTYQQDPFLHGGAALHRVRFDEEPPRLIFQENVYRLIDYGGDLLCAMTPVQGLTWMYDEFWVPYEKGQLEDATVLTVDMDDNPHLDQKAKEAALGTSSEEEREARKTGRFVHFHGRVYGEFGNSHIIPQSEVPEGAPKYVGIDPGIRHMAAVVFVYHTPDDELIVYDELALQGKTAGEVAHEIKLKNARYGEPMWYVIDPSARNKEHITGRSLQMEYADHGVIAFPGQNDLRAGINRVKTRLAPILPDGTRLEPKLWVMENCTTLIDQFRKYRWSVPQRVSQNEPKETPIKRDDHLLDALRYVVMARPYAPVERTLDERPTDPFQAAMYDDMRRSRKPKLPAHFY